MRLYSGSTQQFIQDTDFNQIADKLKAAFFQHFRYNPSPAEVNSWRNSLRAMASVFRVADLTDHGVLLEYQLPLTSKRLDCMITGKDASLLGNAVIVELKQWQTCEESNGENEVMTFVGGANRDVLHPSVQVGQYRSYLADTHTAFYEGSTPVSLSACSYLHNYQFDPTDVIFSQKFDAQLTENPVFTMDDVPKLGDYLVKRLSEGQGLEVLERVEESKYRPSKKLMEHVGDVIRGKDEYVLLDEQLVAYDNVFAAAAGGFHKRRKSVVVIKGGPGTGKSVIAINLMADLLLDGYNAQYATGSKAFTETLRAAIGRRGSVQFKYFNSYMTADQDAIDVLICDEAHRIRESSNNRFMKAEDKSDRKQIEELIRVARVSVFLIDDDQVVRPNEVGSVSLIKEYAEKLDCNLKEFELKAQFRCSGSDGFVNWINNTLDIRRTANVLWDQSEEEFDFRIFESPLALENAIREKVAEGYSGRVTAGFCWKWSKKLNDDGTLKNDVKIGDYVRPWNARHNATHLADGIPKAHLWAYDPSGIEQVGCVYTAQGFEFDYVGVIVGSDLVYRFDQEGWAGQKKHSEDFVVKRSKDQFIDLVKNTYRVLLSRGLKGCYVYFIDKETEKFFRSRME